MTRETIRRWDRAVIVEGYMDVLQAHSSIKGDRLTYRHQLWAGRIGSRRLVGAAHTVTEETPHVLAVACSTSSGRTRPRPLG
jgi:hypothetical protein